MKLLSWNVRGLGQPRTVNRLKHLLRDLKPDVIFLIETKLQGPSMEKVRKKCGYSNGVDVPSNGRSGGLSFAWKESVAVTLKSYSDRHIDVLIDKDADGNLWRCTGFYGAPEVQNRAHTWNLLRQLDDMGDTPWLVIGDFNELLLAQEKTGGRIRSERQMDDFRNALQDCGLNDIGYRGPWFTWEWGKLSSNLIRERLDRGVANSGWWELFPYFSLDHLPHAFSDHCPLLLNTSSVQPGSNRTHHFRFEAAWLTEESCESEFQNLWHSSSGNLPDKLREVGRGLEEWFRKITKEKKIPVHVLKQRLQDLNDLQPTDEILEEILETKIAINLEADREELYWEQRARSNWLKNGDRNTKLFHSFASSHRRKNRISCLRNDDNENITSDRGIQDVAYKFFKSLFTSQGCDDPKQILDGIIPSITQEMNVVLMEKFTKDDVLEAVRSMGPLKAAGDDGLGVIFYQRFWHILGDEVATFCISAAEGNEDLAAINRTHIVLIPKVNDPTHMSQFRPISLCNVLFKIISKMFANRLQRVIHACIDEAQCAFVPGRLISDNIIVAYELLHAMKMKRMGKLGNFALKLDMSKAYDRVEWPFLESVLNKMGFDLEWIRSLMDCVKTVSYAITINGQVGEVFTPSRGIRQGDPLSPFLFVICGEGLSALLRKGTQEGKIRGLRITRSAPLVSHLLFADDSYIFGEATATGASNLKDILHIYSRCSGQLINFDKSSVFFSSNVNANNRQRVCRIFNVTSQSCPDTYLGLPSMVGRRKKESLAFVKDKITRSLNSWSTRSLSTGGKEVYIKSVLQALPLYAMGCFLFPRSLCNEIESMFAKYWWQKSASKRGMHWCSWQKLCLPKENGGLGFRDLGCFNLSLLAKQGWRIMANPTALVSKILKARYFPQTNFLNAVLGSRPSYIWKSIWSARKTLEMGIIWRVGSGRTISIWDDPWIPLLPTKLSTSPRAQNLIWVSDLICPISRKWKENLIYEVFNTGEAHAILAINLPRSPQSDLLAWEGELSGCFSVRSAYRILIKDLFPDCYSGQFYKSIWNLTCPSKVKINLWKFAMNYIPVMNNLHVKRIASQNLCPRCSAEPETICQLAGGVILLEMFGIN
ncbi:hypothetical protein HRI_000118400 [Hibiscus trionum]|uniref:Reverse transcriptase domain-containing protein n=1 Tax=Hibiscus trionum TaxID=183268 RepID=A0A9W7LHM0_HIBTR|nr:hypothetical protein HRI_000118400 [Hibiscus trionum]